MRPSSGSTLAFGVGWIGVPGLMGLLAFGFDGEPPPRAPAVVSAKAASKT